MNTVKIQNNYNRTYTIAETDMWWQRNLKKGIYQVNNLRMLRTLSPNCKTIIDIGANIGTNTIEYATWCKNVIAFEPTPELYNYLLTNINDNITNIDIKKWYKNTSMNRYGQITTYNIAIGAEDTKKLLLCRNNNKGKNCIVNNQNHNTIVVSIKTLDSFNFTDVDIIKIDTEGYEMNVLLGSIKTIQKYKPFLQLELIEKMLKNNNSSVIDVYDFLYNLGYISIDTNFTEINLKKTNGKFKGSDLFFIPT